MTTLGVIALVYMVLSRLAYVVGVGTALLRQDRYQVFTRDLGVAEGFHRFKRGASWVMNNDAVALVLVCVITRDTLQFGLSREVLVVAGLFCVATGGGVKIWARDTLGAKAYYWYNFFDPAPMKPLERPGPYRYLDNPMYTVGYLPAYGLALICASWPGFAAAGFAQAAIVAFHLVVERPHYERLKKA
jgi:protein-S-isoprenylcysteine O-methyltransferase Ste14